MCRGVSPKRSAYSFHWVTNPITAEVTQTPKNLRWSNRVIGTVTVLSAGPTANNLWLHLSTIHNLANAVSHLTCKNMYVLTELHKQNFRPKQHMACKVLHSCTADISHWYGLSYELITKTDYILHKRACQNRFKYRADI